MSKPNPLAVQVARLTQRVADLERRLDGMIRPGKVAEVSEDGKMVRLKIGKGPDGTDQLSPWRPHAQFAGALKIHTPAAVGQNMMLISPAGSIESSFALPLSWNKDNPSPSDKGDENALTFGDVAITLKGDGIYASIGGTEYRWTGEGFIQTGGKQEHDGLDVGSTHRHGGVEKGFQTTDVPVG